MKPVPVEFHLGPLTIHTYGIGLAITFVFAIWYAARRFRAAGQPSDWLYRDGIKIVLIALVGSRVVHVAANVHFYAANPAQIPLVWHGGLSSFGGLLFGVPAGIHYMRRNCPGLPAARALDIVAPVLMAGWAVGRLLGPQFMIAGGGHPTSAWYGLSYAGEAGKRIPVPIFQGLEDAAIWCILVLTERRRPDAPAGLLVSLAAGMWGLTRFTDELFWLAVPPVWDAVEVMALLLSAVGWIGVFRLLQKGHRRSRFDTSVPGSAALAKNAHAVGSGGAPPRSGLDTPRGSVVADTTNRDRRLLAGKRPSRGPDI